MQPIHDAASVEARLADAGRTLLALRVSGVRPAGTKSSMPEVIRSFDESYGWQTEDLRPSQPSPRDISAMDQALSWIALIPQERYVLRRIVGARCLTNPRTDRPLFSWRKIADTVGASHMAVKAWHSQGIDVIVAALNRPGLCAAAGGRLGPKRAEVSRAIGTARTRPARAKLSLRPSVLETA